MRGKGCRRVVLTGMGLLVGLLGMHGFVLRAAGRTTAGVVTQAMQFVNQDAGETDFSYQICYQFAVDGQDYVGNASGKNIRDVARLPMVGSLVEIRYLPGAPFLNESADINPLPGFAIGLLGILLIGLSLRLGLRRDERTSEACVRARP